MKTIADLQKMIREPASKEWFKKHGTPKSMALKKKSKYPDAFKSDKEQDTDHKYKPYK